MNDKITTFKQLLFDVQDSPNDLEICIETILPCIKSNDDAIFTIAWNDSNSFWYVTNQDEMFRNLNNKNIINWFTKLLEKNLVTDFYIN